MGSQEDDHVTVYDEDDDSEDEDLTLRNPNVDEDDVDLIDDEEEDDSMSSGAGEVTVAVAGAGVPGSVSTVTAAQPPVITGTVSISPLPRSDIVLEHRKIVPLDDSRRLFQRLWTDEDEIELLQGFLDYTNQRIANNPFYHHHHSDTTAFYDQIKDRLQLDFNKNTLVEKLRRLKKKYRNVLGKISSGKDYVFKSAHDQITFDISCKIWNNEAAAVSTPATGDVGRFDDEESNNPNPNPNPNPNFNIGFNLNEQNGNGVASAYPNSLEKKTPRSRKRSRSGGVKIEEKISQQQLSPPAVPVASNSSKSIPNLVEEAVKSSLLPLFKELLEGSVNAQARSFRGLGGMNLDPFAMSFGGLMNLHFGDVTDEKWRKQHISELEVCSKRLELVQDQIKSQLEELKSTRR